ncbi:hypothetical protein MAR_032498 [Mya arenaria]|uniref:Uncharacterized protein n=1 Tax=Mya arenaria TaxID=6604 RepID=A0ABY7F9S6_MYAAR|nr:hypothetical protein MAR_032498 [Mya arenaria]
MSLVRPIVMWSMQYRFHIKDSVGNISSVGPECGYQANAILLISLSPKTPSKFIALNAFMHGISFFLKLNNLQHFTRAFIIQKMLCGLRRNRPVKDTKMPLTIDILKQILRALPFVASLTYETSIFNAAFVIAFFCFSIIGEIAEVGKADPYTKVAQISDVSLSDCKCTLLIRANGVDSGLVNYQTGRGVCKRTTNGATPQQVIGTSDLGLV